MLNQNQDWYYSFEVEPGLFTPGKDHANIAISRRLLRNIEVKGMDCIDVGTQEGMVPILLKRRGANFVLGYDRLDGSEKINFLKERLRVQFDYLPGVKLRHLPAALKTANRRFFDLVVFSGVLYHALDPFWCMGVVRGFCKLGGLLLIETEVRQHPKEILFFNARGCLFGGRRPSTYFVPSTAWLDYALRMLELEPLYAAYIGSLDPEKTTRLAVLCKTVANPCALDADDAWIRAAAHRQEFGDEAEINWKELTANTSRIQLAPFDNSVVHLNGRSLFDALANQPPYAYTRDELRLSLNCQT